MIGYRYSLVRFVPDRQRMEPVNVGVILQGGGALDIKLSPHAAKRKDIDTTIFQQWREFLLSEVRGEARPLFQPPKTQPQFLQYLADICDGAVVLSAPLVHQAPVSRSFTDVLEALYLRLVAAPESASQPAAATPSARFRQVAETRRFLKRGMKRHAHVAVGDRPLWMPYRHVENGRLVAIDKIEVNNRIGSTANEIERIPKILALLPEFRSQDASYVNRFVLLADRLERPFAEQSQGEFEAMRSDLEEAVTQIRKAGGEVLRSRHEVEELGDQLDAILPPLHAEMLDEAEV